MSAHGRSNRLSASLGPDHILIARRMAVVMGFALVAKMAGAAKEVALAWRYGVSEVVDAYVFTFNLVNLPISIWLIVLTVVFIPLAARLRKEAPSDLPGFRAELFGLAVLAGGALAIVAAPALMLMFDFSLSGLSAGAREIALSAAPMLAALIPPAFVAHYGSVLLMSEGRNTNTLFEGIPAFVILLALLAFDTSSPAPLVWGTLAGFALHAVVMLGAVRRVGKLTWPRLAFSSPAWKFFWTSIGVMLLAQALQTVIGVIDQFFAARLGEGAVSTLSYSTRLLSLILTLGAVAIARATLPVFSEMRAQGKSSVNRVAMRWVQIMLFAGGLIVLIGWPAADTAIRIVYERGAFTAADTERVAEVFRYALLQVPFYCAAVVLMQLAYSAHVYHFLLIVAVVKLAVKVAANFMLVEHFGLTGLMMATVLMYVSAMLTLLTLIKVQKNEPI